MTIVTDELVEKAAKAICASTLEFDADDLEAPGVWESSSAKRLWLKYARVALERVAEDLIAAEREAAEREGYKRGIRELWAAVKPMLPHTQLEDIVNFTLGRP